MGEYVFEQLNFVRNVTLHIVKDVTESQADALPEGFNNNIRWNLGHIYLVQELFAFHFAQEPVQIPEGFSELFAKGTTPTDWTVQPPQLSVLIELLKEQPIRIREKLIHRLDEQVANPFTLGGLTLKTIGEFLTLSLYHEGGHAQNIKMLKKLNTQDFNS